MKGTAGWYLRVERSPAVGAAWALPCAAVFAISLAGHGELLAQYATGRQPSPLKQDLIRELDARHIRYAYADYWTAYYVTFMTRERIVVGAVGMVQNALHLLAEKVIVELDEERKAAMVSNLMVVLTGDRAPTPVLNTGTLYS